MELDKLAEQGASDIPVTRAELTDTLNQLGVSTSQCTYTALPVYSAILDDSVTTTLSWAYVDGCCVKQTDGFSIAGPMEIDIIIPVPSSFEPTGDTVHIKIPIRKRYVFEIYDMAIGIKKDDGEESVCYVGIAQRMNDLIATAAPASINCVTNFTDEIGRAHV